MPPAVQFSIHQRPATAGPGVPLFSVVRNEAYFLPHFLRHYRALGVREFWFLDDRSTDGTRETLLAQPDCGVIVANLRYGDPFGDTRFGVAARTLVPRELLRGRWVLSVDADEFLLLPPPFATLDALVKALESAGLEAARAPMLDFFPDSLRALAGASPTAEPFAVAPWFDAYATLDWPDGAPQPAALSVRDGVRPRMLARILESAADPPEFLREYRLASMWKVPLLFWGEDTRMLSSHKASKPASDRVQLALAHFKFYPGYRARIADALATQAYWQGSAEYRFLDFAARELEDWPLAGPRSRRFRTGGDLEESGLMYSRLTSPAA